MMQELQNNFLASAKKLFSQWELVLSTVDSGSYILCINILVCMVIFSHMEYISALNEFCYKARPY